MSQNTVRKYACKIEERQFISTENTAVVAKDDPKHNGNLLCIIRLTQLTLDQFHGQQLEWMDTVIERKRAAKALALCSDKERPVWRAVRRRVALLVNGR